MVYKALSHFNLILTPTQGPTFPSPCKRGDAKAPGRKATQQDPQAWSAAPLQKPAGCFPSPCSSGPASRRTVGGDSRSKGPLESEVGLRSDPSSAASRLSSFGKGTSPHAVDCFKGKRGMIGTRKGKEGCTRHYEGSWCSMNGALQFQGATGED